MVPMIEPPDQYASFVWVKISAQSSADLFHDTLVSKPQHLSIFNPLQVMNESECFNKLVDPVPETYIGLEPDGLYKECRQVIRKSKQESPCIYDALFQTEWPRNIQVIFDIYRVAVFFWILLAWFSLPVYLSTINRGEIKNHDIFGALHILRIQY